jgi:hypothetical protein
VGARFGKKHGVAMEPYPRSESSTRLGDDCDESLSDQGRPQGAAPTRVLLEHPHRRQQDTGVLPYAQMMSFADIP